MKSLAPKRPAPVPAPSATALPPYDEVPLAFTGLFSVFFLVWFLQVGLRMPTLGALRIEFLLGGLLGVLSIVALATRTEPGHNRLGMFALLYLVFLTVHLPLSQFLPVSWKAYMDWVVKYACMTLFTVAFVRNPKTLRLFMLALLIGVLKVGQEAFLGKITGSMVWENQGIMRLHGTQGSMFGHPNSLSGLAVSTLPFAYYFWTNVDRRFRLVIALMLLFAINIIVFTGSRTGYVASFGLVGFLFLRSQRKGFFLAAALVLAVVALPFVPDQYVERFQSSFGGKEKEGSSKAERTQLARDAWETFLDNPQGTGIYTFMSVRYYRLGKEPYDTHNLYLQILSDLGVGGLVVFGLFVAALGLELFSSERRLGVMENRLGTLGESPPPEAVAHLKDVRFARACAASFFAFVATRLFLGIFGHDLYEMYWWLSAGVAMTVANQVPLMERRTTAIMAASPATPPATPPVPVVRRLPVRRALGSLP